MSQEESATEPLAATEVLITFSDGRSLRGTLDANEDLARFWSARRQDAPVEGASPLSVELSLTSKHGDGITFRGVEVPPEDDGGRIKSHAAIDAYFHADYVPVMDKEMRVLSYLPVQFVYLEPRASESSAEVALADWTRLSEDVETFFKSIHKPSETETDRDDMRQWLTDEKIWHNAGLTEGHNGKEMLYWQNSVRDRVSKATKASWPNVVFHPMAQDDIWSLSRQRSNNAAYAPSSDLRNHTYRGPPQMICSQAFYWE